MTSPMHSMAMMPPATNPYALRFPRMRVAFFCSALRPRLLDEILLRHRPFHRAPPRDPQRISQNDWRYVQICVRSDSAKASVSSSNLHVTYRVAGSDIRLTHANFALRRFDDRTNIVRPGDAEIRGVAVRTRRALSPLLCAPGPSRHSIGRQCRRQIGIGANAGHWPATKLGMMPGTMYC
jgi:hypothetical protein